jgi:sporulation protein YlmC with PRC-barrel domain
MDDVMPLTDLIHKKVYAPSGNEAGVIENLGIDPASGIVRFANINIGHNRSIRMPWAAMVFTKSKSGFVLTHRGASILQNRTPS